MFLIHDSLQKILRCPSPVQELSLHMPALTAVQAELTGASHGECASLQPGEALG